MWENQKHSTIHEERRLQEANVAADSAAENIQSQQTDN